MSCKVCRKFICSCKPRILRPFRPAHIKDENGLLPCPFCGAKASIEEFPINSSEPDIVKFSVGCDSDNEPECMGYQSLTMFDRRADAINAWNKRNGVQL